MIFSHLSLDKLSLEVLIVLIFPIKLDKQKREEMI